VPCRKRVRQPLASTPPRFSRKKATAFCSSMPIFDDLVFIRPLVWVRRSASAMYSPPEHLFLTRFFDHQCCPIFLCCLLELRHQIPRNCWLLRRWSKCSPNCGSTTITSYWTLRPRSLSPTRL